MRIPKCLEGTTWVCMKCGKVFSPIRVNQKYCQQDNPLRPKSKGPCVICGKPLPIWKQKYCSDDCRYKGQERKLLKNLYRGKSSNTTGAISELRVAIDLLSKGYDVYRALSPTAPCDLAVLKDMQLLKLEVRTAPKTKAGVIYKVRSKQEEGQTDIVWAWVCPDEIIYEPPLFKSQKETVIN